MTGMELDWLVRWLVDWHQRERLALAANWKDY